MSSNLKVTEGELNTLITDLKRMQETLQSRITSLNAVVDRIEGGWKGSAAGAYNSLQRDVNENARKIRQKLVIIEEAMRKSRDGFSEQEVAEMQRFQKMQGEGSSRITDLA